MQFDLLPYIEQQQQTFTGAGIASAALLNSKLLWQTATGLATIQRQRLSLTTPFSLLSLEPVALVSAVDKFGVEMDIYIYTSINPYSGVRVSA